MANQIPVSIAKKSPKKAVDSSYRVAVWQMVPRTPPGATKNGMAHI
jgi:hypothetical protein